MEKKLKVTFAPGCFDAFEGTQDELDELINHIQTIFEGKSPEDIEMMSIPVSELDIDDEEAEAIRNFFESIDVTSTSTSTSHLRKLN